jgi:predicted AlkP superfamily pyrophosphatase or phosphodiesterase
MGPLDSTQHQHGAGSPQAKEALRQIDASLARTLETITASGRQANVVITSDHGFAHHSDGVNAVDALVSAGLKASRESSDVIVASQSQSLLLYVQGRNRGRIEKIVRFLQQQTWVDVLFTRGGQGGQGSVAGTFSLDLIRAAHPTRSADIVVSLAWTSTPNAFGVPGAHTITSATTGALQGGASGHGGLNPWVVRNTFIAWGPDFKTRVRIDAPAALPDIAPTVLALTGIEAPRGPARGRALRELLAEGPAVASLKAAKRTIRTSAGAYRASVEISTVDGHDYVDSGSRER